MLNKGDVPYEVKMTEYGGHARHMVKGSREQGIAALEPAACSGVLVIGGDGTVCEVKLVCMSWLLRLLCRPLVCMVRGSAELRHFGVRWCVLCHSARDKAHQGPMPELTFSLGNTTGAERAL